jgi:dihydroneopterin aldolase
MDKILLTGVHLDCHLGVPEEERNVLQEIVVDLEMGLDLRPAGRSDSFADTIDYARVRRTMEETAARRPYVLVESVAETIADELLRLYPRAVEVKLLVRKPRALRQFRLDSVGVAIVRRRES